MSEMWKRSYGLAIEAPPDERGGERLCETYCHRATSRLYRELNFARCPIAVIATRARGHNRSVSVAAQISTERTFAVLNAAALGYRTAPLTSEQLAELIQISPRQ